MFDTLQWIQPWNPETEGYAILVPEDGALTLALIEAEYAVFVAHGVPRGQHRLPIVGVGTERGVVPVGVN